MPLEDREVILPSLEEGDPTQCRVLEASSHTTQPPARYTEASLVKELEERGIGRPSTYAVVIDTLLRRDYVWKKGSALVPTWTAFAKQQLLERYFAHLIDYEFTATMEEALDAIARGEGEAEKWLHAFWFGNGQTGLKDLVNEEHLATIGLGLLPVYWHLWKNARTATYDSARKWLTIVLAAICWYAFLTGHVVNNTRGFDAGNAWQ